jgi:hypothetical protein
MAFLVFLGWQLPGFYIVGRLGPLRESPSPSDGAGMAGRDFPVPGV